MKNILKTALALVLALSVLLVPMTVSVSAAKGDYNDKYVLNVGASLSVDVPAETTVYVQAANSNGSIVDASANVSLANVISYCTQIVPASGKTATFQMIAERDWFALYNSGTQTIRVTLNLTAGEAQDTTGTVNDPEVLVLEDLYDIGVLNAYVTKALEAGNEGYYYKVIAPGDGAINVGVGAFDDDYNDMGWIFFANNVTQGKYGDNHWSDDEEVVYSEQVPVKAGDEVVIFAATYDPANMFNNPAGNIGVSVSFSETGSSDCPVAPTVGKNTAAIKNGEGYYYSYTATKDGTATVTVNSATGWQFYINGIPADPKDYGSYYYGDSHYYDDDPVVSSESIDLKAGETVEICINTYDPNSPWAGPSGSIDWTFAFVAGEVGDDDDNNNDNPSGDLGDDEVNYAISDSTLEVGTKEYAVDATYPYTAYAFTPDEKGKYTISTEDGVIGIVSYIDMWVQNTPSADNVNATEVVWECNSVGQGIFVAINTDADTATITVTREELIEKEEVPWIIYENKVTPEPFVLESDFEEMMYVDTFDDVNDQAVLGEDGYYHLNDAYGPILYACLSDSLLSLSDAQKYGQLKEVFVDENGNVTERTDFYEAFEEYFVCADPDTGVYPLTEDLIAMFRRIGAYHGWYGENGYIGGDLEDAWMFACYYNEGETFTPGATTTTNKNDSPATADVSEALNVALLAILAAGAVMMTVASKKATVR